jgi:lipopolysaccharide biosynthesis regulator YciM
MAYWTSTKTLSYKIMYEDVEHIKKNYNGLVEDYQVLLTKTDELIKLLEQILKILIAYNPKLAEQTKEQLEKINEQKDGTRAEPRGDTT